jgi:hypothetical protein
MKNWLCSKLRLFCLFDNKKFLEVQEPSMRDGFEKRFLAAGGKNDVESWL